MSCERLTWRASISSFYAEGLAKALRNGIRSTGLLSTTGDHLGIVPTWTSRAEVSR